VDAGDSFIYTVSDDRFEIINSQLKLKAGVSLDFEGEPTVDLTVTSTDTGGLSKQQAFTLNVSDVKEDTAVFNFKLTDAAFTFTGSEVVIDGPGGQHFVLSSDFDHFQFTDGTVNEADGNASVSDLFYYAHNRDVWQAGVDAEAHYAAFGWKEGRDPNAVVSTTAYLGANKDVAAAGINPLEHYHQNGWKEGRDASASFDTSLYLINNPDVKAAGIDPLEHFLDYGRAEGRQAYTAVGQSLQGTFDAEYYLLANPDVAQARVDALTHYNSFGWKEGRDPNAFFDSSAYLSFYQDVAAAGVNPLAHYLKYGIYEGRSSFGDSLIG
jgi:hypothetical protein